MSARTTERYNDFGKTLYINSSYIPETYCVGSVGQFIKDIKMIIGGKKLPFAAS